MGNDHIAGVREDGSRNKKKISKGTNSDVEYRMKCSCTWFDHASWSTTHSVEVGGRYVLTVPERIDTPDITPQSPPKEENVLKRRNCRVTLTTTKTRHRQEQALKLQITF